MSKVHDANRLVHAHLAHIYDQTEPHFRPENQANVRAKLQVLRSRAPGGRLLDVGCGTGFIIHLAAQIFEEIHGVDITPEMMQRVDISRGSIKLHVAPAEALPFADGEFDAVSAYSFIDHVADVAAVLREMARVLKPGGIAYIDLVPNRLFWRWLKDLPECELQQLSPIVARERQMVTQNSKDIERQYGIDAKIFEQAEPGKLVGGIEYLEFVEAARTCGFATCEVRFEWFLGQGAVMHGQSHEAAAAIDGYLRDVLPLARHLYKYLSFVLTK
jgi:ubiquinone/menaquinone biosynthesis C-methylase UbiE